jgi:hypothetical protein
VTLLALALSLFIAAVGALGVAAPDRMLGIVRAFQSPAGLYTAAAIRLVFGIALFLAAPGSRAPELLRILGIIVFVAGLVTPLFGLERFGKLLDWWTARGTGFVRGWCVFTLAFGLLLAWALVA